MSYLVLARKYRPETFEEVVGQPATARTLRNAIRLERVAHAYLFAGPRGVGKTSMARILAKALCCSQGPTPVPCGQCDRCRSIQRGNDLDVVEIDAASNRGIDDIRALREKARVAPMQGQKKLYIVDEVHQLTSEAFNALLKILEEPPAHVLFVLATTEPERIPDTIRSRCQFFEFRRVSDKDIALRLAAICQAEGIEAEEPALLAIARAARGGVRDSQSLLDQAITHDEGKVTLAGVLSVTGSLSRDSVHDLLRFAVASDLPSLLASIDRLCQAGISPEAIVGALLDEVRELLVACAAGQDSGLLEQGSAGQRLQELARQLDVDRVLAMTALLLEARRRVREQDEPRLPLEAALIRIARAPNHTSIAELLGALNEAPSGAAAGTAVGIAAGPPQTSRHAASGETAGDVLSRLAAEIGVRHGSVASYLKSHEPGAFDGSTLELIPGPSSSKLYDLNDRKVKEVVEQAARRTFGKPLRLRLSDPPAGSDAAGAAADEPPRKPSITDQAREMFDGESID